MALDIQILCAPQFSSRSHVDPVSDTLQSKWSSSFVSDRNRYATTEINGELGRRIEGEPSFGTLGDNDSKRSANSLGWTENSPRTKMHALRASPQERCCKRAILHRQRCCHRLLQRICEANAALGGVGILCPHRAILERVRRTG